MANEPAFHYRKEVSREERGPTPYLRADGTLPPLLHHAGYLPEYGQVYLAFFAEVAEEAAKLKAEGEVHLKPVQESKQAIEDNNLLYGLFQEIFVQINPKYQYRGQVQDWEDLLRKLDVVLRGPPKLFIAKNDQQQPIGEPVGVPIYLILDFLINTLAGYDLFRNRDFNNAMRKLLNAWGEYLITQDSSKTLNTTESGWF
ncbi:hypothetical protein AAF712_012757 [Marasmius tenuissimus]|uniref:L-tryptophan decarboxylase PsiD-like domain-containing protein n=1 Tax=Marasmius tenuissimus TaxID=585030 RepID=A0ABR2ZHM3_9AGAR